MKHFFVDTNVLLDLIFERQPFVLEAKRLIELAEQREVRLYVSTLSFKDMYYLVRQTRTHADTMQALTYFDELTTLLGMTADQTRLAMRSEFTDYEDSLQHQCACSEKKIEAIVTRNTKDFKKSVLPVLTPAEALLQIGV